MTKNLNYELTKEFILIEDTKLFRIQALKDFGNVKKGYLGGFVESEENLSQDGNCWIYDNAKVYGEAKVYGNACVSGNAKISNDAQVYENAQVYGDACVSGNSQVYGNAQVSGYAQISGNARVFGDAMVFDNVIVYNDAVIFDDAWVCGNAKVYGEARVYGNARVFGDSKIFGDVIVYGGLWPISPFYAQISKRSVSSCSYIHLKIGCLVHTIDEWKERGEKIGKENSFSDEEIALYTEIIKLAEKYIEVARRSK